MPKTTQRRPKRYVAKKTKRRPICAISGCQNRAQSADSPHCCFHQPMLPVLTIDKRVEAQLAAPAAKGAA